MICSRRNHTLFARPVAAFLGAALLSAGGCYTDPGETTAVGAAAGGAFGAGLGAIIGSQTGDPGTGVAVGAVAGSAAGAAVANSIEAQDEALDSRDEVIERQDQQIALNRTEIDDLRRTGQDGVTFREDGDGESDGASEDEEEADDTTGTGVAGSGAASPPVPALGGSVGTSRAPGRAADRGLRSPFSAGAAASRPSVTSPRRPAAPGAGRSPGAGGVEERDLTTSSTPPVVPGGRGGDAAGGATFGGADRSSSVSAAQAPGSPSGAGYRPDLVARAAVAPEVPARSETPPPKPSDVFSRQRTPDAPAVVAPTPPSDGRPGGGGTAGGDAPAARVRGGPVDTGVGSECELADAERRKAAAAGEPADKLFHTRRALRLCPTESSHHVALGEIYLSLKRRADAQFEFKEALRLNPSDQAAADKLKSMKGE